MNIRRILVSGILPCLLVTNTVNAASMVSYFPHKDLGQFLADKFDLASIRSSFGPRRSPQLRTFADFGMQPTTATDHEVVFDTPGDWLYALKIMARRDVNGDGIEDLEVCFHDRALNGGTYDTSKGLLITRYSAGGYAVAFNNSACEEQTR